MNNDIYCDAEFYRDSFLEELYSELEQAEFTDNDDENDEWLQMVIKRLVDKHIGCTVRIGKTSHFF